MNQQSERIRSRAGLSLLEVMLAIAILGGSLTVIGQLVRLGVIHAIHARLLSEGNLLCDAKVAEFSAGVLELENYRETGIAGSPGWFFTADVEPTEQQGLLLLTVTVGRSNQEIPVFVSVRRFLPDPEYDPAQIEEF